MRAWLRAGCPRLALTLAAVLLGTGVSSAFTVYDVWVAFHANGGEASQSQVLYRQDSSQSALYEALPTATRTGYDFAGWTTSSGTSVEAYSRVVLGLTDLYATWTPATYTVVFNPNGAGTNTVSQTMTYDVSATLKPNTFAYEGHAFLGWNDALYDLSYVTNSVGGSNVVSTVSNLTSTVKYADGAKVLNLAAGGSCDLYAIWKPNSYTVRFNPGSTRANGTMGDLGVNYGQVVALPANTYSRAGYTFAGWATQAGAAAVLADHATVSNLAVSANAVVNLYATWKGVSQTVSFDPGSPGSYVSSSNYVGATFGDLPDPGVKDGFVFAGWRYFDAESDRWRPVYPDTKVPGSFEGTNVSLVARWKDAGASTNLTFREVFRYTGVNTGLLTFSWRTSCEDFYIDARGATNYTDYLEFLVDGHRQSVLCGIQDEPVPGSYKVGSGSTAGLADTAHTYVWRYVKDGADEEGEDTGWVDNIRWTDVPPGVILATSNVYTGTLRRDFSVRYYANNETGFIDQRSYTTTNGLFQEIIDLPVREGYHCAGWHTDPTNGVWVNAETSVKEGLALDWVELTNTLGRTVLNRYEENGTNYTVYAVPLYYSATNRLDLYAHWVKDPQRISFNANGGEGTMTTMIVESNAVATVSSNLFERFGCEFKGWTTNACAVGGYGEPFLPDGGSIAGVTNDVVLYAAWNWVESRRPPSPDAAYTNMWSVSMETNGAGVLTFDWRSACEPDLVVSGRVVRTDGVAFCTNNVEMLWLAGTNALSTVVLTNLEDAVHSFLWTFQKDLGGDDPAAAAAVTNIRWQAFVDVVFDDGFGGTNGVRFLEGDPYGDRFPVDPVNGDGAFLGWYTAEEGTNGVQITSASNVCLAVTNLYARWGRPVGYSFDSNGGGMQLAGVSNKTFVVGKAVGPLPDPGTVPGMTFAGWRYRTPEGGWAQIYAWDPLPDPEDIDVGTNGVYAFEARWKPDLFGDGSTNEIYGAFTTNGIGVLRYDWRTSCEGFWVSPDGTTNLTDYAEFLVDGVRAAVLDGIHASFVPAAYTNGTGAAFTGAWRYVKDGNVDEGDDLAQVTNVVWCPAHWIVFHANDGRGGSTNLLYVLDESYGVLPELEGGPAGRSHFAGWWTSPDGGRVVTVGDVVRADVTDLYAHWTGNAYSVVFDPNGGSGDMDRQEFVYGEPQALRANAFTKYARSFVGWSLSSTGEVAFADCERVADLSETEGALVTLFAVWGSRVTADKKFWPADGAFDGGVAATWDGWIEDGDGGCAGTILLKTSKARNGFCTVSGSIQMLGRKKAGVLREKMPAEAGEVSVNLTVRGTDERLLLTFGANGFQGEFGNYTVFGARNVWSLKKAPLAARTDATHRNTAWSAALEPVAAVGERTELANGYLALSAAIKSRGKASVRGVAPDGTKISTGGQVIVGDGYLAVPVIAPMYSKKGGFGLLMRFGTASNEVVHASRWDASASRASFVAGLTPATAVERVDPARLSRKVDVLLGGAVPATVSCTTRTGLFRGTYRETSLETGRKVSYGVNGVMVGEDGYGAAVNKSAGSMPVVTGNNR